MGDLAQFSTLKISSGNSGVKNISLAEIDTQDCRFIFADNGETGIGIVSLSNATPAQGCVKQAVVNGAVIISQSDVLAINLARLTCTGAINNQNCALTIVSNTLPSGAYVMIMAESKGITPV